MQMVYVRTVLITNILSKKRPESVNAVGTKRLDDPDTLITNEKVLAPMVFKVLGQLYQNLPPIINIVFIYCY